MANFDIYYTNIGFWACIIYIVFGGLGAIFGLTIAITNIRARSLVTFVSTSYFFGAITFAIGSQGYYILVKSTGPFATSFFWSIVGTTGLISLISGISLTTVKSLKKYSPVMIGFAGGFSAMNLFYKIVPSEIVLLLCAIALGIIIGCMSFVFNESFQIIVIPCTAFNLLQIGIMAVLDGTLALLKVERSVKARAANITSYTLFGLSIVLLFIVGYLHYKNYYLEREQIELDHKLITTPKGSVKSPSSNDVTLGGSPNNQAPEIKIDDMPSSSNTHSQLSTPPLASRDVRASPIPHRHLPTPPTRLSSGLSPSPKVKPLPLPPSK
ncbi:hypothetical protein K502DRAFT_366460 [Neoconidiobolus thromboides FSU 785]|nr:hypothetical protein K502DRAFT_366460 [Neoconidiobolus thromboides FSU 785]